MDKKDKIIKQLLESDMDIKVPQDFTDDVMKSVFAYEESKKPSFTFNGVMLFLIITLSVLSSLFVFYYYDNSFFSNLFAYFSPTIPNLSIDLSIVITYVSDSFHNTKSFFSNSPILLPLALGIAALFIIERLLSGFKIKFNMMMSW